MGQGKYSPVCPHANACYEFKYNCYGKVADYYNGDQATYDEKIHFDNYDEEGFDRYGYSSFDANGFYVGIGNGVDRLGYCAENEWYDRDGYDSYGYHRDTGKDRAGYTEWDYLGDGRWVNRDTDNERFVHDEDLASDWAGKPFPWEKTG